MILRYHYYKDPERLFGIDLKLHHYVLNTCYPVSENLFKESFLQEQ